MQLGGQKLMMGGQAQREGFESASKRVERGSRDYMYIVTRGGCSKQRMGPQQMKSHDPAVVRAFSSRPWF